MGIQKWVRQRVSLVAGQAQIYETKAKSTNALYIVNNNAADVKVAAWSDVANNPEATIKANSSGPVPLSSAGESVYLYSTSSVTVIVVEITTDDLSVVFAMQVVISDAVSVTGNVGITGSLPTGANLLGLIRQDSSGLTLGDAGATLDVPLNDGATGALYTPVLNYGYTGGGHQLMRVANVFKPFDNISVGAGSSNFMWIPSAGKKFRLMTLILSVTVAGEWEVWEYNSSSVQVRQLFVLKLEANKSVFINLPLNGIFAQTADNRLAILNQSGSAGNAHGMAMGTEE